MTKLDIFILIVFVVSVAWGFRKGVIVQAGALGGLILGVLLCHIGGDYIAAMIASKGADAAAHPGYVDKVMANIILFIIGYLSVRIVAHFFKTVVRSLSLGVLDRIAGALFSCFEWMLALSILLTLHSFPGHVDHRQRPCNRGYPRARPRSPRLGRRRLKLFPPPPRYNDCLLESFYGSLI